MILLAKKGLAYYPAFESDRKALARDKDRDYREVKDSKPRNPLFHKKFFALLKMGFENQEEITDFEGYRSIVTMRAGYYKEIKTKKGLVYLPKSISFENMKQEEFEKLYKDVFQVIFGTVESKEIENELINFL